MSEATSNAPLTVVLVHGAFADSSSWDGVIERLQAVGIEATAAPNPLRGSSHDSAYVASFMKQVPGPVLAVGHSESAYPPSAVNFGIEPIANASMTVRRLRTWARIQSLRALAVVR
jgi:hypothetical protein